MLATVASARPALPIIFRLVIIVRSLSTQSAGEPSCFPVLARHERNTGIAGICIAFIQTLNCMQFNWKIAVTFPMRFDVLMQSSSE